MPLRLRRTTPSEVPLRGRRRQRGDAARPGLEGDLEQHAVVAEPVAHWVAGVHIIPVLRGARGIVLCVGVKCETLPLGALLNHSFKLEL